MCSQLGGRSSTVLIFYQSACGKTNNTKILYLLFNENAVMNDRYVPILRPYFPCREKDLMIISIKVDLPRVFIYISQFWYRNLSEDNFQYFWIV